MMRAVSLWQPWASAIPLGCKGIETRGKRTHVRGEVAIHAAKKWTAGQREFNLEEYLLGCALETPPLGAIVALVEIVDCKPVEELSPEFVEAKYGDYSPGRFGWILGNIRPLSAPVPCAGSQGFFFLPPEIEARVRELAGEPI